MNKLKDFIYLHFFYRPDFSMSFHSLLIDLSFSSFSMLLRYDEGNEKSFDIFYSHTSKKIRIFTKKLQRKNYFSDYSWKSSVPLADKLKSLIEDFSAENFVSVNGDLRKIKKLQKQVNTLVFLINQKVDDDVEFIKAMQQKNKGLNLR